MYNNRPHPLLEQVPLTVSPFVSLPTATTLSYNYKTMPSNIPPSSLGIPTATDGPSAEQPKPRFVVSSSGHAASPDDILESCHALLSHVTDLQKDAERELREFEERIKERELAEKRRLAPGWLDSEARLLEPERAASAHQPGPSSAPEDLRRPATETQAEIDEGAELDKAFGVMALK
ncbi:Uncharacterized protein TPAR_06043 [Tolypocladium paradoxum]|uniref:Uncharacterized protein n=1 Tax=Tolypocladium paradoxum TaxID=94208 RepID=A0A2S4KU94_9HYPO|nr:Uncharacterized protein TPAR_06043 [Tolypocladium paradoxum]